MRDRVTAWLRDMVRFGDIIVEGRDITTAVFPRSGPFLPRGQRRSAPSGAAKKEVEKGIANQSAEEVSAPCWRGTPSTPRAKCAPLKKADGAHQIDSTSLTLDQVVQTVLDALPAEWKRDHA